MRADPRRGFKEQAVRRTQLLVEHLRTREDDFQLVLLLQLVQIPAEARGIPDELPWGRLKDYDDAGLVVLGNAPVDELHAQQGLARAGRAFDQDQVALENPVQEDLVQAINARLDPIALSQVSLPFAPRKPNSFLFWSGRSLPRAQEQTHRAAV